MLALNSPEWSRLISAAGDGDEVVNLLRQLQSDQANEEIRQELLELILHQDTIYTSTLAAMPYLAELAESTEHIDTLVDLYISCGWIEASRQHGSDRLDIASSSEFFAERQPLLTAETTARIAKGYKQALERIGSLYATFSQRASDSEVVYLLAAQAAFAGEMTVARLLFTHPEGDEYNGNCPSCEVDWYLWQRQSNVTEWVIYAQDPVYADQEQMVCSEVQAASPSQLRVELRTLLDKAKKIGAVHLAETVQFLDGLAVCPDCGEKQSVWAALG
ncbi:hypothetical protein [Saccharibacillus sp. JS10]|uniref:hypothetical protein n=1 Tax=Saccharibacillus sp. JS10 TaxID=2950552 RepID=UPI002109E762|nr:hypothetical protein [Saccharibacillus sp. JS10]MCQ4086378.1 hypothetical protein [Saccharibacillus sp. JS10]